LFYSSGTIFPQLFTDFSTVAGRGTSLFRSTCSDAPAETASLRDIAMIAIRRFFPFSTSQTLFAAFFALRQATAATRKLRVSEVKWHSVSRILFGRIAEWFQRPASSDFYPLSSASPAN